MHNSLMARLIKTLDCWF